MQYDIAELESHLIKTLDSPLTLRVTDSSFKININNNDYKVDKIYWKQYAELQDYIMKRLKLDYPELML